MKTWPFLKEPSLVPKPGVKHLNILMAVQAYKSTTSQSCTNPEDTEQSVAVTLPRAHRHAWEHRGKRTISLSTVRTAVGENSFSPHRARAQRSPVFLQWSWQGVTG